ncbi:MAG: hypothetical protein M1827_006909 [Pycnora praestabilis]|nr:MAG: hypothetical protein M1827_006909 [Pycnora praestabilis]
MSFPSVIQLSSPFHSQLMSPPSPPYPHHQTQQQQRYQKPRQSPLRRFLERFRRRRNPSRNDQQLDIKEKPKYHHVPTHAASSFLKTTTPMTLSERYAAYPDQVLSRRPGQPTRTLREQSDDLRAKGAGRAEISVGRMES